MEQPHLPIEGIDAKRCVDCGELKPYSEFHRNRTRRDGRQARCRACNIALNRRWYRDHPEARRTRMNDYARRRHLEAHRKILDYLLDHPCVDCGESDPVVLDFDHLRDKVRNVSSMLRHRWESVLAEIEKCDVVCANCHRRRTAQRSNSFRYRMGRSATNE